MKFPIYVFRWNLTHGTRKKSSCVPSYPTEHTHRGLLLLYQIKMLRTWATCVILITVVRCLVFAQGNLSRKIFVECLGVFEFPILNSRNVAFNKRRNILLSDFLVSLSRMDKETWNDCWMFWFEVVSHTLSFRFCCDKKCLYLNVLLQ